MESAARFWSKVDKWGPTQPGMNSPCWLWTGRVYWDGYGEFSHTPVDGKYKRQAAHRTALEEALSRPLAIGMEACHRCDVRHCVNPDHLFEGTHAENEQDKVRKGRANNAGERNGNARLTDFDVDLLRNMRKGGASYAALARAFCVHPSHVRRLCLKVSI